MRRHVSLQPLSRFHRSVLFLALILKENPPKVNGYPESWEDKLIYAKNFYTERLKGHFDRIENNLIPIVINESELLRKMSDSIIAKQSELGVRLSSLEFNITEINIVGDELEKHVRMVEREFFQEIQEVLTENQLNKLSI